MMTKILLLVISLVMPNLQLVMAPMSYKTATKWVIRENSSLRVKGSTNVNQFSCAISSYPKTDTVTISTERGSPMVLSGRVRLDVKNFDCNNMMMTRELRKTLKEDKFPYLHVAFLSLKEIPLTNQTDNIVKGIVEIEIAGVKKKFEISYQLKNNKDQITLLGCQTINFSDFNLTPPKKMGKLIQAKDKLSVIFELHLQLVKPL
ncbi:YceI family protein [Pedobacter polaris]|uniref:YceI family protein n=1 Tax=Pedobacter polaris TaxID=2571273 RepID=A0A4U1CYH9_9SPHI|nr:YceI family protein [Pedobacter polaris]TKC12388.1 YceI family protein [Pedobacter polaris]